MTFDAARVPSTSWIGRVLRWPLRAVPKGTVVRIPFGPARGCRWQVGAGPHGYWLGVYEPAIAKRFAAMVTPGADVWDVGANAGYYSVIAATRGAVVHAFEPLPANAAHVRRHAELNRLADRITVHEVAVGAVSGTARLEPGVNPSQGRLADTGVPVTVVRLDDEPLPPPALVKMDIEGGEVAALSGMRRTLKIARPTIFLALHGTYEGCAAELHAAGYRLERLYESVWLATPPRT